MTEYSEFLQLLKKEIEYPQSVSDKGVQGMVIVQFEVERDGTPDRFKSFILFLRSWMQKCCVYSG
ncbi:energy transducer TonB [Phocaeicola barnesiae]|uniref:Energy transducer TonB n=2 Tax=Phocaeicola barnesiae TaxID=376804 RepID=A0AAW5N730_9BACT|nr:energy transducer TonB [Phocaeicola barnesiae]MCR8875207.1 energy transducer TonB [Phocaeicola barnesiae]MDM8255422.1 energy transducer TonB [Phocaeicola barnesiae]MDM8258190.1 energy transducer TonB [Phocaeicola barnesiae]